MNKYSIHYNKGEFKMASLFTFMTVILLLIIIPMFIIIGYITYRIGYKKGLSDQDRVNYEKYKKFYYENHIS